MKLPKAIDALQLLFQEALAFFQTKDIVTPEQWDALDDKAKRRAFSVAGVARKEVIATTAKAVERAIAKGESFDDFKKRIGPQLERSWGGTVANPNWRMELIFRNNVQQSYNVGRYEVTTQPDVLIVRPYRMFSAIEDTRTTEVCRRCHGTILPAEDPWWDGHSPQCHHACRSGTISLSRRQADKRGVTTDPPAVESHDGFGDLPHLKPVKPSPSMPREIAEAGPT
jgi:SPP1 gp7 family putative phage head morphogenesis protein